MTTAARQFEPLPPRARMIGMWLFLASLVMLFAAAMLGYVLVRLNSGSTRGSSVHIPWPLALSTVFLILSSITIERAVRLLQREKIAAFRRQLIITLAITLAFVAIQTPSLIALLATHASSLERGVSIYGLVFVLILLHALHVIGGIVPLVVTIARARAGRYDHEHIVPVRSLALYWHFLGLVWIVMLGMFVLMR
jgi:cytochrome c oxidase subunit 3